MRHPYLCGKEQYKITGKMQKNTISSANFADTKPHYELLDGLRGVAAILVLFYHIFEGFSFAEVQNKAGDGIITTLNHGHIAVDFFFILSGFVISYAYDDRWRKMSIGGFFKRRLIRLHPMLIMGAIIGFAAFAFVGFERWDHSVAPVGWVMIALLLTMFMIPALPGVPYEVRGNGEMFPLNGPGWSLFFEYIGNILYALFIRRLSVKMLAAFTFILGILHAWFFVGNVSGYDMVGVGWTIDEVNFWGGLVRMLFPFSMGMLLARTFKPRKVKGAFWICSVMLVAIFAVPYIASDGNYSTLFQADGEVRMLSFQLGQIEKMISSQLGSEGNTFIRIGKSLIINRSYIYYINVSKQKLTLSDVASFSHTVTASKEALKQLKDLLDKEAKV